MDYPPNILHKIMFLCIGKGDAEQVQETLDWGADPHWCTKKRGTPAIVKATRGICAASGVVKVLLAAGADPNTTDADGCRAVDHVRRRLRFYEGKPRKPIRRSPSLTAGGRTKPAPARVEVHRASGARPPRRGRGLPARAPQGRRARPRHADRTGADAGTAGTVDTGGVRDSGRHPISLITFTAA